MSEEEFFNRAINRICKDYDYNFANEFKLLFLKKEKEIERLKEENNNLKFTPKTRFKDVIELREENERLNKVINELLKRIAILEREVEEHEGF